MHTLQHPDGTVKTVDDYAALVLRTQGWTDAKSTAKRKKPTARKKVKK